MKKGSKIDYIITTRRSKTDTETVKTQMSDHNAVIMELELNQREALNTETIMKVPDKEMFFSNVINEIKEKHIKYYLRYILQTLSAIIGQDKGMNHIKQTELLTELKSKMPIVVKNSPRRIYEVEKRINEMLEQRLPYKDINKEISKLRKYSFQSYVEKNLQALQTNPKAYHQCIKNIIGWNMQLGPSTAIDNNTDIDPQ